jgi:hypothetical protein
VRTGLFSDKQNQKNRGCSDVLRDIRYGYNDRKEEANVFAASLIEQLNNFVQDERLFSQTTQLQFDNRNIRLRPGAKSVVHIEEILAQINGTQAEQIGTQHVQEDGQIL